MPFDSRRINGPESSVDYQRYVSKTGKKGKKIVQRDDGRSDDEHRALFLKTGIVTKAKGSAYVEQGQTKVICAVYGPREIPRRSDFSMRGILNCTFERAPFASHQRRAQGPQNQDPEEDEVSMALGQALEATVCMHKYPKSQIDVYVTVLEDDGSILAAALTAAGLALADAAVQMFDTLVGASVKRVSDRVVVDPSKSEESSANEISADRSVGQITIGYQPSLEQIALMSQDGYMSTDDLVKDTRQLTQLCSQIVSNVHLCLVDSIKKASSP